MRVTRNHASRGCRLKNGPRFVNRDCRLKNGPRFINRGL